MITITRERAKKLVKAWEGHKENHTNIQDCFDKNSKCLIHKLFMELKKDTGK